MSGPVLANLSPAITYDIDPRSPIMFDVTAPSGTLVLVIPAIILDPNADPDVVHDFTTFSPRYVQRSTRVAITNGFRYTLVRGFGWPAPPRLRLFAADSLGNVLVV